MKELSDEEIKANLIEEYNMKIQGRDILNSDEEIELPDLSKTPIEPCDDIIGFIMKYGSLEEWEKSILKIVKRETQYFIPQIETKIMNEGWASYFHYNILKSLDLPEGLHFEFIKRHNDVIAPALGGLNPYYVGFKVFEDIEKRYGRDKLFEVRYIERDNSFLRKYLTQELCKDLGLFQYAKKSFEFVVDEVSDEEGWKSIRDTMSDSCGVGSIPYIRIVDLNKRDGTLTLEHVFDGRELELLYAKETLKYLFDLWGHKVILNTHTKEGRSIEIVCDNDRRVTVN